MTYSLINLFFETFGEIPQMTLLSGGGSARVYYKMVSQHHSAVGAFCEDSEESERFIRLDRALEAVGVHVPHIFSVSDDKTCYILQDLGNIDLLSILECNDKITLARKALDELVKIQTLPPEFALDYVGYPPFSSRLVKWDLNYFKYDFLKPADIKFYEERLEDDFELLSNEICNDVNLLGFMYRDFQSRNIMVKDGKYWFIDFQGARKGPLVYDAVSFIWQAKAPFSFEDREALKDYYINLLSIKSGVQKSELEKQFDVMQLFRGLQVLGAYGFRGLIEKKLHFIESIPKGIMNIKYLLEEGRLNKYPELKRIFTNIKINDFLPEELPEGVLTVKVYSFSYKKGYPEDATGNGGGFMFDCRALPNPGRFEPYKTKTGLDEEVISFLREHEEPEVFLANAMKIVQPSIEVYLKRGFTSLQVGFGCTGGQHRSVYCAENFAEQIKNVYKDIRVKVIHREQKIEREK